MCTQIVSCTLRLCAWLPSLSGRLECAFSRAGVDPVNEVDLLTKWSETPTLDLTGVVSVEFRSPCELAALGIFHRLFPPCTEERSSVLDPCSGLSLALEKACNEGKDWLMVTNLVFPS